jgi:hypothetical protein
MIWLQEYTINKDLLFRDRDAMEEMLKLIHNTMVVDFMNGQNDIWRSKKALIDEINQWYIEYIEEYNSSVLDALPSSSQ